MDGIDGRRMEDRKERNNEREWLEIRGSYPCHLIGCLVMPGESRTGDRVSWQLIHVVNLRQLLVSARGR
jgi:hypothetical protein